MFDSLYLTRPCWLWSKGYSSSWNLYLYRSYLLIIIVTCTSLWHYIKNLHLKTWFFSLLLQRPHFHDFIFNEKNVMDHSMMDFVMVIFHGLHYLLQNIRHLQRLILCLLYIYLHFFSKYHCAMQEGAKGIFLMDKWSSWM